MLDRFRTIVTLWIRSRAESWANPNLDDLIDPSWQRHPGLIRATHPKVEPEIPEAGSIRRPRIGERVSMTFDGEVVDYDAELGHWTLRGNTRGAQHIDWTVKAHWATEFHAAPEEPA